MSRGVAPPLYKAAVLSKSSCLRHMTQQHDLPENAVREWLTCNDGKVLSRRGHGCGHAALHLRLSNALLAQREPDATGDAARGSSENVAAGPAAAEGAGGGGGSRRLLATKSKAAAPAPPPATSAPPSPPPAAVPTARTGLSPLRKEIANLTAAMTATAAASPPAKSAAAGTSAEPAPTVRFLGGAAGWTPSDGQTGISKWPIALPPNLDFSAFARFLSHAKGHEESTVRLTIQRVGFFFSLFDLPEHFSFEAFVVEFYSCGAAEEWISLPIANAAYATTRHIQSAMTHFTHFLLVAARRQRHDEAARCLTLFDDEILKPLGKRAARGRDEAHARRMDIDGERLQRLPLVDVLRAAIKESMLDLQTIHDMVVAKGESCPQLPRAANVTFLGIAFTNSYAGRPGEWVSMKRSDVVEFLAGSGDALKMSKHKTSKKYGTLGRHIPAGNRRAMQLLLDIHESDGSELFILPTLTKTGNLVVAANLLKTWGAAYTPGHQHPGPTLQRKFFHTETHEAQARDDRMRKLCEADGHSLKTAQKHYVVRNAESHARNGLSMFSSVLGEPVEWPSDEELESGRGRSLARIQECFLGRRRRRAADEPAGSGGDSGGEPDDLGDCDEEDLSEPDSDARDGECSDQTDGNGEGDAKAEGAEGEGEDDGKGKDGCDGEGECKAAGECEGDGQGDGETGAAGEHDEPATGEKRKADDDGDAAASDAAKGNDKTAAESSKREGNKQMDNSPRGKKDKKAKQGKNDKSGKSGEKDKKDKRDKKDKARKKRQTLDAYTRADIEKAGGSETQAAAEPEPERPGRQRRREAATSHGVVRRSRLDPQSKAWIEGEAAKHFRDAGELPKTSWYEPARARGMQDRALSSFATAEGLRSHVRAWAKKTHLCGDGDWRHGRAGRDGVERGEHADDID